MPYNDDDFDDEREYPRARGRSILSRADRSSQQRPERDYRRSTARRTVFHAIQRIPRYIKLLLGLMRDDRVSRIDRFFVVGALAYVLAPVDFIPDIIPFFGQVDDIFLVMTSLQRLVERSDEEVLLDHWSGDPRELDDVNLARVVASASFFLPLRLRRRLKRMARE